MTKARAVPGLLKRLNEREVLETIRAGAPISRAEISRRAGISKPTVSLALQSLLQSGLVREAERGPDGPGYGAVYFEPVPEAALVLGLDLGARFVRGAICDLVGQVRARQDVELGVADAAGAVEAISRLRATLLETAGLTPSSCDGVVVGVPGRRRAARPGCSASPRTSPTSRAAGSPTSCRTRSASRSRSRTTSTSRRSVSSGRASRAGSTTSSSCRSEPAWARASCSAASSTAAATAQQARSTSRWPGSAWRSTRRPRRWRALAEGLADARAVFEAARGGDDTARTVVEEVARRIALHIAAVAAVADVSLVVLGGGIGTNGDLLLAPVGRLLDEWLPTRRASRSRPWARRRS